MHIHALKTSCRIVLLATALSLAACHDDDNRDPNPSRTVLVYMLAENNLSNNATGTAFNQGNIDEMVDGMTASLSHKHNLIVYVDPAGKVPALMRITENGRDTLRVYEEQNSISPRVMRGIMDEVIQHFPAESYGLVLWSHGNGWLPGNADDKYQKTQTSGVTTLSAESLSDHGMSEVRDPFAHGGMTGETRAFGIENNYTWMEINDLISALPDHVFNYIIFDACLMASTEVCYALKEKADYIVASAIEILANGFPYTTVTPLLFKPQAPTEVAQCYYEFYNKQYGSSRSGGIGVIRTSALDTLAVRFASLTAGQEDAISNFNLSSIQRLDRTISPTHFDLADFAEAISQNPDRLQSFLTALRQAVTYHACTPTLLAQMNINAYCGLSIYVPISDYADLNSSYKATAWSRTTGYGQ